MKRWMLIPLAVLMAWPAGLAAQEEGDSPTWWVVFSEKVAPENVMAFEAASTEAHAMIEANAPEGMVYYTHSGPETGYMYAVPMESMADFMTLNEQWMSMVEEIGWEEWEAMADKSDPLVEHRTTNFYVELTDQSYHPEGFMESLPGKPVRHFDWLYPKAGMEQEFNEVLSEWAALYAELGIDQGWTAYQAVSGDDLPMVVLMTPAESAGAYYMMSEEVEERLGERGEELMMKSLAMMRDFSHNEANFRPELSVMPDEM